jgi:hypothetical protein
MPHQDKYAPFRKLLPVDSLVCAVFHINFICVCRGSDLSYVFQIWHCLLTPPGLPVSHVSAAPTIGFLTMLSRHWREKWQIREAFLKKFSTKKSATLYQHDGFWKNYYFTNAFTLL